jgi:tetratricopeptide (TPR) repeat protein
MGNDVFISYTTADREIAEKIREAIQSRSMTCWIAPENVSPGSPWATQIIHAIERSKVVVMIFSSASNNSMHLPREANLAIDSRRDIILYRIEDIHPAGDLKYYLCITHWLDAFFPLSVTPENLNRLCDAVERIIHNFPTDPGSKKPAGVFISKTSKELRLRIAGEMVRQKNAAFSSEYLSSEDKRELQELTNRGFFKRSVFTLGKDDQIIIPIHPNDCIDLLVEWISENKLTPEQLLDIAVDFALFNKAIAKYLFGLPENEKTALLGSFSSMNRRETETLIQAIVDRTDDPAISTETKQKQIVDLSKHVLSNPAIYAVRGLLIGAQRLIGRSQMGLALALHERIDAWLKEKTIDSELEKLLVETAIERSRVEIRMGLIDAAENRLRHALPQAASLNDSTLTGILINNLARALLERPSRERIHEAVRLLEDNLSRLAPTPRRTHLAAAYNNLADALTSENPEKADEYFRKDIEICREISDALSTSDALDSYASFLMDQGHYRNGISILEEELQIFEHAFDPRRHARALANMGRAHMGLWKNDREKMNELGKAREYLQTAKGWFLTCPDEPKLFAPLLENLGRVLYILGGKDEGISELRSAITQYRKYPEGEQIAGDIESELVQLKC